MTSVAEIKVDRWTTKSGKEREADMLYLYYNEDKEHFFKFGLGKARLVLQHIENIKKFVEYAEAKKAQPQTVKAVADSTPTKLQEIVSLLKAL